MDAELKSKWTDALRSGEFKQHRGSLHEGEEGSERALCCLGVLWVLSGRPAAITHLWEANFSPAQKAALIDLNDQEKKSFAEIADYIDANL